MIGKWLRRRLPWPPVGQVDFGAFRRTSPAGDCAPGSSDALDRHFIEEFLARHAADIGGRVLQLGGGDFALRHGGVRVSACISHDPSRGGCDLPSGVTDLECIVLPGTLQRVLAPGALLRDLHGRLRRGGVLLATVPGAAQRIDADAYWRFTPYSARRLFAEVFGERALNLSMRGNVLVATAHAHRLPAAAIGAAALRVDDPEFPFEIGVRAVRQAAA